MCEILLAYSNRGQPYGNPSGVDDSPIGIRMDGTTALRQGQPHVHHTLVTGRRSAETVRTAVPASSPTQCPYGEGTSHVERTLSQLHLTAL
jgi:hypothetical protein